MKKLTIITAKFPYFSSEAFIESEYPYLEKKFETITFVPTKKGPIRKNYESAKVCDSYSTLYKKKFQILFKILFSLHFYSSIFNALNYLFKKNHLKNIIEQEIHYHILKRVISANKELFDENTVVYSYWFNTCVYSLLKIKEEQKLKYKVVCRAHRFDVYDENGEMPNRKYCFESIDKVFPISQDAICTFTRKYGHKDKMILSRLGVKDHKAISNPSNKGTLHILSVSQVNERKRVLDIYKSLKMVTEEDKEHSVIWTHFGDGPLDKELRNLVNSNSIANLKVEIMGRVPNTSIYEYYEKENIDIFINISTSEGVPVSIMEAFSFGVPVIATNVGGTSELITEKNGILLNAYPSILEVKEGIISLHRKHLNRQDIKKYWNEISNAEYVFPVFADNLYNV